jgi:hypothetical protein
MLYGTTLSKQALRLSMLTGRSGQLNGGMCPRRRAGEEEEPQDDTCDLVEEEEE